VFPTLVDVLIRQAALLGSYARSAHASSVVLLAAALLLPFAQGGQLLSSVARSARATTTLTATAERPHTVLEASREGQRPAIKTPAARAFAATALGLPVRLGALEARPDRVPGAQVPEMTSPVLERRDLERGPPFFL
jgi:hypothetical protein